MTFLSLPGLDAFSRTTSMVAILFAAFSMASTVVAIFRHKADLERPISHVGIEGMMVITVCDALRVCQNYLAKKPDLVLDIATNCYFISTTGLFGLCYHSLHHRSRSVLIQRGDRIRSVNDEKIFRRLHKVGGYKCCGSISWYGDDLCPFIRTIKKEEKKIVGGRFFFLFLFSFSFFSKSSLFSTSTCSN